MSTATQQPDPTPAARPAGTIDPARASYLHGFTDDAQRGHHTLRYLGNGATYEVSGYADGSGATCTCPSYSHSSRTPRTCKHCLNFVSLLEHTEYERQAARKTHELQLDESFFTNQPTLSPDERLALNAIRQVLRARGVRSLGAARRGRQAAEELAV
jgi:hypothetical protein